MLSFIAPMIIIYKLKRVLSIPKYKQYVKKSVKTMALGLSTRIKNKFLDNQSLFLYNKPN